MRLDDDPPVIEALLPPTSEASGNVALGLRISDSSADLVGLNAEWRPAGGPPDAWQPATPAGVFPDEIATQPGGVEPTFFWDTAADLGTSEQDVLVRFTPDDRTLDGDGLPIGEGAAREGALRVDNNAVPIVQIDEAFLLSEDTRRGIPLSYRVLDAEGDPVRVVLQWRREDEADFPDLGASDVAELTQLLRDPDYRRAKQVCTPYGRYVRGRIEPVDGTRARLPQLLGEWAWLLPGGVEGLELELLRPVARPTRLASGWAVNPLQRPVAALPIGDGDRALVLDAGSSSLLELNLATGTVVRSLATWLGEATAMTYSHDRRSVWIALHGPPGGPRLVEVDLATGALVQRLDTTGGLPEEAIRALVGLSKRTALATAGDALWRLEWIGTPGAVRVATGLAEPWGLALDPVDGGRVLVAEHAAPAGGGAGRIVAVELATGAVEPLVASHPVAGDPAFPRPTALAFQPGSRLLVALCEDGAGQRELRGLVEGRAPAETFLFGLVPTEASSLALGGASSSLLALPSSADLVVDGGVEQRRTIAGFVRASAEVTVVAPFDPPPRPQQAWRIAQPDPFFQPRRGSAGGESRWFVWDSEEVPGGGRVRVRASCFDTELGVGFVTGLGRSVQAPIEVDPIVLPVPGGGGVDVTPADLDEDGDLDLVVLQEGQRGLRAFLQDSPLAYSAPTTTDGPGLQGASGHIAQDIDGDGLLDIAYLDVSGTAIVVYFQSTAGSFTAPITLSGPLNPISLSAADLDGDGRVDLATANAGGGRPHALLPGVPADLLRPARLGRNGADSVSAGPRGGRLRRGWRPRHRGHRRQRSEPLPPGGRARLHTAFPDRRVWQNRRSARHGCRRGLRPGLQRGFSLGGLPPRGAAAVRRDADRWTLLQWLEGGGHRFGRRSRPDRRRRDPSEQARRLPPGGAELLVAHRPRRVHSRCRSVFHPGRSRWEWVAGRRLGRRRRLPGLLSGASRVVLSSGAAARHCPPSTECCRRRRRRRCGHAGARHPRRWSVDPSAGLTRSLARVRSDSRSLDQRRRDACPGRRSRRRWRPRPRFVSLVEAYASQPVRLRPGGRSVFSDGQHRAARRISSVVGPRGHRCRRPRGPVLDPGFSQRPPGPGAVRLLPGVAGKLLGTGARGRSRRPRGRSFGRPGRGWGPGTRVHLRSEQRPCGLLPHRPASVRRAVASRGPRDHRWAVRARGRRPGGGRRRRSPLHQLARGDLVSPRRSGRLRASRRDRWPGGGREARSGRSRCGRSSRSRGRYGRRLQRLFQTSGGAFEAPLLLAAGSLGSVDDVDGDGLLDLTLSGARILYQRAPRTFAAPAAIGPSNGEILLLHDLDVDGDQGLIVSDGLDQGIFFQLAPGRFSTLVPIVGLPFFHAADLDADGDVDIASRGTTSQEIVVQWGGR